MQDAEKQKQNLLGSPDQIKLNKLALTDPTTSSKPGRSLLNQVKQHSFGFFSHEDTSENISGEKKVNGHETSLRDQPDENTKSDESEEESSLATPGNGHEKEETNNLTNGKNNGEATAAAATAVSDQTASNNGSETTARRIFE